jgi:3'-phosphoadenosine 5'-phosphosulfate (PAPS) 3'-phosphatase
VVDILRPLHACWELVCLDDGPLRAAAALKLALLLEEQADVEVRSWQAQEWEQAGGSSEACVVMWQGCGRHVVSRGLLEGEE